MPIDLSILQNTSFALLVWYLHGDKKEAKIYCGVATWYPGLEQVKIVRRDSDKLMISLSGEQLDRIRSVDDDLKDMFLNCDYAVSLTLRDLSTESTEGYEKLDELKW